MISENAKETKFSLQFLNIKLKLDDLLILFILYILYNEGLENQPLFIILILLFLS